MAQLMSEIIGRRVVEALTQRLPKSDIYHRKSERVVMVDRQMMAKMGWQEGATGGHMQLRWNAGLLRKMGLQKDELADEVEAPTPSGAGSARCEA